MELAFLPYQLSAGNRRKIPHILPKLNSKVIIVGFSFSHIARLIE